MFWGSKKLEFVLLWYALGFAGVLISQAADENLRADTSAEFTVQSWTKADGLPDNEVHSIIQSHDGYLWIGTRAGLVRFDGLKFTVFNRVNHPEMGDDDCGALVEDHDGNIWMGTASPGVSRWDGHRFQRISLGPLAKDGGSPIAGPLLCGRDGSLWIGHGFGLSHFVRGKKELRPDAQRHGNLMNLVEDSSGFVYHLAGSVFVHDPRNPTWRVASDFVPGLVGIDVNPSGALFALQKIESNYRLVQFSNATWTAASPIVRGVTARPPFLFRDGDGDYWFPCTRVGVTRVRSGKPAVFPLRADSQEIFPLCMTQDRDGTLWIGTETHGLHSLRPKAFRSLSLGPDSQANSLFAVCQRTNGDIWLGGDAGASVVRTNELSGAASVSAVFTNAAVRALAEDLTGRIWLGARDGLVLTDGTAQKHFTFANFTDPAFSGALAWNKIRAISAASDGAIWFGVPRGLIRTWNGTNYGFKFACGRVDVRCILKDQSNRIWVGTDGMGLHTLDPEALKQKAHFEMLPKTKLINIELDFGDKPFVDQEHAEDPHYLCSSDFPELLFTTTNGLSSDHIWCLFEDAEHALWIGTERGLNRLDPSRRRSSGAGESLTPQELGGCERGHVSAGQSRSIGWRSNLVPGCSARPPARHQLSCPRLRYRRPP